MRKLLATIILSLPLVIYPAEKPQPSSTQKNSQQLPLPKSKAPGYYIDIPGSTATDGSSVTIHGAFFPSPQQLQELSALRTMFPVRSQNPTNTYAAIMGNSQPAATTAAAPTATPAMTATTSTTAASAAHVAYTATAAAVSTATTNGLSSSTLNSNAASTPAATAALLDSACQTCQSLQQLEQAISKEEHANYLPLARKLAHPCNHITAICDQNKCAVVPGEHVRDYAPTGQMSAENFKLWMYYTNIEFAKFWGKPTKDLKNALETYWRQIEGKTKK